MRPSTVLTLHERDGEQFVQRAMFPLAGEAWYCCLVVANGHALALSRFDEKVQAFERTPAGWEARGTPEAAIAPLSIVHASAIQGDRAVLVGRAEDRRLALVLVHENGAWKKTEEVALDEVTGGDFRQVALDGDTFAVATGLAVFVFVKQGDHFVRVRRFEPIAATERPAFGATLALKDGRLVVGPPGDGVGGRAGAGAAYVFER
ncbi:MAG TPA: hypothetical protein VM925_14515 [Labilithrix sp.]|nr:hypothetical protein [Labilithrix sp.]